MTPGPTLDTAVRAFLSDPGNHNPNTRRAYHGVLGRVSAAAGRRRRLSGVTSARWGEVLGELWGDSAPATWNRNRAAVKSWLRWCTEVAGWKAHSLPATAGRRREPRNETRAVSRETIGRLCGDPEIPVRDRTLYRMLYDTASRASAVLGLDIEDLDVSNRCATIRQKGGDHLQLAWSRTASGLLREMLGERDSGPVFTTLTGGRRLSYARARALIAEHTGGRITLHQLRHSSLTHLAEAGVSAPTLMAKSGHRDIASLQRYARPGFTAVQEATELLG